MLITLHSCVLCGCQNVDYIAFMCFMWLSEETVSFALYIFNRGHAVEQLVEALRHKSEGYGFDSRGIPTLGSAFHLQIQRK